MITFEVFKDQFLNIFGNIEEFIDKFGDESTNPFINAELKENLDEDISDSYNYTDEKLKRIFYFPTFDIYICFEGRNQSYSGTSWSDMKEVKPTYKTVNTYE